MWYNPGAMTPADAKRKERAAQVHTPLAERMRPRSFDRVYGQDHILGPGKILAELIASGRAHLF